VACFDRHHAVVADGFQDLDLLAPQRIAEDAAGEEHRVHVVFGGELAGRAVSFQSRILGIDSLFE